MEKLPLFNTDDYELAYISVATTKNQSAIIAMQSYLLAIRKTINELVDRSSSIDLEAFRISFVDELETLLVNQNKLEVDEQKSMLVDYSDINYRLQQVEIQVKSLIDRVAAIELLLPVKDLTASVANSTETEIKHFEDEVEKYLEKKKVDTTVIGDLLGLG
ncbi:hypothetical protein QUA71_26060 [Microcoleus sp. MON1_C5]|uniref:hypothetical protein n=1 Tax=Microcoleus sp. MON1_C5 TaxID=2818828 RepID=UPI002FD35050